MSDARVPTGRYGPRPRPTRSRRGTKPPRVAVCFTPHKDELQPEAIDAIRKAADLFAKAGAEVREREMPSPIEKMREGIERGESVLPVDDQEGGARLGQVADALVLAEGLEDQGLLGEQQHGARDERLLDLIAEEVAYLSHLAPIELALERKAEQDRTERQYRRGG